MTLLPSSQLSARDYGLRMMGSAPSTAALLEFGRERTVGVIQSIEWGELWKYMTLHPMPVTASGRTSAISSVHSEAGPL